MAFTGRKILITGLLEIDLPSKMVRLCDGGFVDWPARGMFLGKDPDFGTIGSMEAITEGMGDQAPGGRLTLLPPSVTAAADLFQPTAQGRSIRAWLAEIDPNTGQPIGDPTQQFDGLIDTMTVTVDRAQRSVEIEFIDAAEKLFMVMEGNVLSPRFQRSLFPDEGGMDFASGSVVAVPWGIAGPARGSIVGGSGGGGFGGRAGGETSRF